MKTFIVWVIDNVATEGLQQFGPRFVVDNDHPNPDVILIRSTKLTIDQIPKSVKAIGRAGVGVDNLPVKELTERGVLVFNAPGGNARGVAELTIWALITGARNTKPATAFLRRYRRHASLKQLLERRKKQFVGIELEGKVLGIIGLGAIGGAVAELALAMGMEVVGNDDYMSSEALHKLPPKVKKVSRKEVLRRADFISLHAPLNPDTHHMIGAEELAMMKEGVVLINLARGELVDVDALIHAMKKLRAYVHDFPESLPWRLKRRPRVNWKIEELPHLGASTKESQVTSAIQVVKVVRDFFLQGFIRNASNASTQVGEASTSYRLVVGHGDEPLMLSNILRVIGMQEINVENVPIAQGREKATNWAIIDLEIDPKRAMDEIEALEGVVSAHLVELD